MQPYNNFDLIKSFIPYKIVKYRKGDLEQNQKYYLNINIFNNELQDIFGCSLYFVINDKFCMSHTGNEVYDFLSNINLSEPIVPQLIQGTESLQVGVDFFLSDKMKSGEYPENYFMSSDVRQYDFLSDIKTKDIDSIGYFVFLNRINSGENIYTQEELDDFNSTFMKIIQNKSDKYNHPETPLDYVYKYVIDYYANGQNDNAIILMNSIFNTTLTTSITASSCGCDPQSSCVNSPYTQTINTGTNTVPLDTATCLEKYQAAMYQWLIQMLSSVDFYKEWMFEPAIPSSLPNRELLEALIELLSEFLNNGYDFTNINNTCKTGKCGHTSSSSMNDCGDLTGSNNPNNCSNYTIIENYKTALEWIRDNKIDENKNKIYIYGKQFAEIFPLLNF